MTDTVHARGGSIFVQLMHTGRVGHPANLPSGGVVMAPSAVAAAGKIYTDALGMQAYPVPQAMTEADIRSTIEEYAQAARNAMAAGFDGVELHGANGYLIEQFLNPEANQRTDAWGASVDGRIRFAIEVARATAGAIGAGRVGIRLSPYGLHPGMGSTAARDETFTALSRNWLAPAFSTCTCRSRLPLARQRCRLRSSARCAPAGRARSSSLEASTGPPLKRRSLRTAATWWPSVGRFWPTPTSCCAWSAAWR